MNTYVKTEDGEFIRVVDDDEEEEEVENGIWENVGAILNGLVSIGCSLYTTHKILQWAYRTTKPKREE